MTLKLTRRIAMALLAGGVVTVAAGLFYLRHRDLRPNRKYDISAETLKEWKSYGGSWEVLNEVIHNNSAERGPMLVSGSDKWTDYTLVADLQFDGNHGDMGVIIRSNDEEEGVDAYRGYYAGLRTTDGSLVIGRADYGWMEAKPVQMPGGVHSGTWYRLTVTSYQCSIGAASENLSTHQKAYVVLGEHPCVQSGHIGLRSVATGGSWRNISVTSAGAKDLAGIREHVSSISRPEYPARESDYNHLLPLIPSPAAITRPTGPVPTPVPTPLHIGDLLNLQSKPGGDVVLRGVVTLTQPVLYIQDSTGGILVESPAPPRLNIGDVIEVHGQLKSELYNASIQANSIRFLWNGTPASPISVTPTQAASGTYDARYIEIEGRLTSDAVTEGSSRVLTLTDGIQTFSALEMRKTDEPERKFEVDSTLRVRGVCVLSKSYTKDLTPFVVLLPSAGDIQLVADPPWWNPWHESLLFAGVLVIALLTQVAYFRFRRWKADTITRERERLAHDIHDTMAQGFAGVGYQIQGIHKMVVASTEIDRAHVTEQLRFAYQLVNRCHEEASRTIAIMAPKAPPTPENLLSTLADAAKRIAGGAITVSTQIEGQPATLPLRIVDALLHIGREAVVNAAAHGAPSEITIILHTNDDKVEMAVRDDGHGFVYKPESAGFGILGMQKRARDIAGTLEIRSTRGIGTEVRISARIPQASLWRRGVGAFADLFSTASRKRAS